MLVRAEGTLPTGVTAKDLVLAVIGKIGIGGGTGSVIEFGGSAFRALSMEGAHDGLQHVDRGGRARRHVRRRRRRRSSTCAAVRTRRRRRCSTRPLRYWRTLVSDPGAKFDRVVDIDVAPLKPQVTWGTSPEMVVSIEDRVPDPDKEKDPRGARPWSARSSTWASRPTRR